MTREDAQKLTKGQQVLFGVRGPATVLEVEDFFVKIKLVDYKGREFQYRVEPRDIGPF